VLAEVEFHGEECSGVLLEPRREDNFTGKSGYMCTVGLAHFFTSLLRTTLVQIPPREILLLEEIPGLKRTRIGATFKTCIVKTTFKLKINIKRNPLNFKSIQ
jgi:hypothetical protein